MMALSMLWQWSASLGLRLEMLFLGGAAMDGPEIWDMMERGSSNPFADYLVFEGRGAAAKELPYRPDIVGVIDVPEHRAVWGGRGRGR